MLEEGTGDGSEFESDGHGEMKRSIQSRSDECLCTKLGNYSWFTFSTDVLDTHVVLNHLHIRVHVSASLSRR